MSENVRFKIIADDGLSGNVNKMNTSLKGLENNSDSASKSIDKTTAVVGKAAVAFGGLLTVTKAVSFVKNGMSKAFDNIKSEEKLRQVVKATGMAAGLTAEQLIKMSSEVAVLTGQAGATVQSTQAMLLTFKNLGEDVFPRALKATMDMGAMFGGSEAAAIQLGKALNAPVEGVSALSRVGVQFTEQQKQLIESFVNANDIASAQAVILQELEGQFGGVSEAIGSSLQGQLDTLNNNFDDLHAELATKLLPSIVAFKSALFGIAEFAVEHSEALALTGLVLGVGALKTVVLASIPVIKAQTVALMANPLFFAAVAIATAIMGVSVAMKRFKKETESSEDALARQTKELQQNEEELKRLQQIYDRVSNAQITNRHEAEALHNELKNYGGTVDGLKNRIQLLTERIEKQKASMQEAIKVTKDVAEEDKAAIAARLAAQKAALEGRKKAEASALDSIIKQQEEDAKYHWEKQQERLANEKQVLEYIRRANLTNQQLMEDDVQKHYDELIQKAGSNSEAIEELVRLRNEALKEIALQFQVEEENHYQNAMGHASAWIDAQMSGINAISSALSSLSDKRKETIESDMAREIEAVKLSSKSQRQKDKDIAKIEADAEKRKKEIALKDWRRNLLMSIANIALGITKTIANMGMPAAIPMIIATGVTGAISQGMIMANKPKFHKGGFIKGQSYSGDMVDVRAESGEYIMPVAQQKRFVDIAEGRSPGGGRGDVSIGDTNIVINGNTTSETAGQIDGVLRNHRQSLLEMLYESYRRGEIDRTRLSFA